MRRPGKGGLAQLSTRMEDEARRARQAVARLSPGRRRWDGFVQGLELDPDALARPLEPPSPHDFLICGSARTGTSLLSAVLFQPPQVITVMEPWDGMRSAPASLFRSLREEVESTGRLHRGRLDADALRRDGSVKWQAEGGAAEVTTGPDYRLGVKWPAYWRYLDLLPDTRFVVCVRHPFEVISSFKAAGGRVALGLQYDTAFNRALNQHLQGATANIALRRALLYEYVNSRILPYIGRPNVFVVRYERWFADRDTMVTQLGEFLGVDLGPGPATIRTPQAGVSLTAHERALVRTHCRSAHALGYDLTQP